MRTWHDDTGKYRVRAAFVELRGEKAYLQKADGKTVGVPVLKLRIEDRSVVAKCVLQRATAGLSTRQLERPLAELNDLLQLYPKISPLFVVRAKLWIVRRDLPRALTDLDKAIELAPDELGPYMLRSSVHWVQGNRESAVADYDKARPHMASLEGAESGPKWRFDGEHPAESQNTGKAERRDPFFGTRSSPPRKPPLTVTVSPDTTRVVGPLREGGMVDYVAALIRRCRQGVTTENNAVVLLLQAVDPEVFYEDDLEQFCKLIGVPTPPADGPYFVSFEDFVEAVAAEKTATGESDTRPEPWEKYKAALHRPWKRSEYPVLFDWLRKNDEPLKRIVEASRRPRYYAPLTEGPDPRGLNDTVLWLELAVMEASQLLVARAMLRLNEGKVPEARRDLLACHRLAQLMKQGPKLDHTLFGMAMRSFALDGEMALARYGKLSAQQARQYAADLDRVAPRPGVTHKIDGAERWAVLDVAARIATGGPAAYEEMGKQMFSENGGEALSDPDDEESPFDKTWLYNESLDWDELLRIINFVYDQMVAACRHAARADRVRALDRFDQQAEAMSGRIKINFTRRRVMSLMVGLVPPELKAEHMAEVLLAASLVDAQILVDREDTETMRWQLGRLAYALAGYRADNGSYPKRLTQLRPEYIDEIPTDLFTGEQLRYTRVADDACRLYSLGANGNDDGGKEDDIAVTDLK